ncbi:MAG TPA: sigma 54-interacting transcriptional regulator [Clostridia bacterium]|nr:sigma 54-interacting transcriptional regulator [Clostridia bacterium]
MFTLPKNIIVKDVMSKEYIKTTYNSSIKDIIDQMLKQNMDEVFIIDSNNKLLSVFTLVDIADFIQRDINLNRKIGDFMDKECFTIHPSENIVAARDLMTTQLIGRLPVVENGSLVGVIRKESIINNFYSKIEKIEMNMEIIIDSIHEAICVIDDQGIVKLWNKNAVKLYNISKEEIIGELVTVFFPNALIMTPLRTGEKYDNLYHVPKAGSNVAISVHPIIHNGEIIGVVSSERDITEVRELSKELEDVTQTVKFLEDEMRSLRNEEFKEILGKSKEIKSSIKKGKQVAQTKASILISGESGTGKELFANAIHNHSKREGLFIPVNCSAIPEKLFESEFFGYKKGAFTGASNKGKKGYFELANKGTLFLDEIGEMPLSLQAKLLRVLQEEKIRPVGGESSVDIDVRIVCATNRDLKEMTKRGAFREDLYFRLNVINIKIPPLRERVEDIELLIHNFSQESCRKNGKCIKKIDESLLEALINYNWPGNVRELKNVVEQMIVLNPGDVLTKDSIPSYIKEQNLTNVNLNDTLDLEVLTHEIERKAIETALQKSKGSKSKAAKLLNIPRTTLYYKLDKYNIDV